MSTQPDIDALTSGAEAGHGGARIVGPGEGETTCSRAPRHSYVTLPPVSGPAPLILDFLDRKFPFVGRDVWALRLMDGKITDDSGAPVTRETPYRTGLRLRYFREVEQEPRIPFEEEVVYRDDRILVVCKPHFVPVTPSGPCVNECLLYRQRRKTGNPDLVPVNRIDRETAGLVLLSTDRATRPLYYRMFHDGRVRKEYEAIATWPPGASVGREWTLESRIVPGERWFLSRNVEGPANARSRIRLCEVAGPLGRYMIEPFTGKRHQIRLHLALLGCQIVNDPFYPVCRASPKTGFDAPLQLLARRMEFMDPVTGRTHRFESARCLAGLDLLKERGPGIDHRTQNNLATVHDTRRNV